MVGEGPLVGWLYHWLADARPANSSLIRNENYKDVTRMGGGNGLVGGMVLLGLQGRDQQGALEPLTPTEWSFGADRGA